MYPSIAGRQSARDTRGPGQNAWNRKEHGGTWKDFKRSGFEITLTEVLTEPDVLKAIGGKYEFKLLEPMLSDVIFKLHRVGYTPQTNTYTVTSALPRNSTPADKNIVLLERFFGKSEFRRSDGCGRPFGCSSRMKICKRSVSSDLDLVLHTQIQYRIIVLYRVKHII